MKKPAAILVLLLAQLTALVVWSPPSSAASTWFNLNDYTYRCGLWAGHPEWQTFLQVTGKVGNDGILNRGYLIDGAGFNWTNSKNCVYWDPKPLPDVQGEFVVSANGWGIDSFSVGWGSPSATISGWDKSKAHAYDSLNNKATGSWHTTDDYYFDAGALGDVSAMRIDAYVTFYPPSNNAKEVHVSDVSGNIA